MISRLLAPLGSLALCSVSLWLLLLFMTGFARMDDSIMFLDTTGSYNFGAMILLFITIVLNLTSPFLNKKIDVRPLSASGRCFV